ncbi:hypothetical protein S40285_06070, partial [Stachybotrys chlorohalonatus IBT 40285]
EEHEGVILPADLVDEVILSWIGLELSLGPHRLALLVVFFGRDKLLIDPGSIIGSVAVIMAIGLTAVALRLYVRATTEPPLAEDDYFILVALVSTAPSPSHIALLSSAGRWHCHLLPHQRALGWRQAPLDRHYRPVHATVPNDLCLRHRLHQLHLRHKGLHHALLPAHVRHQPRLVVFALAVLHWAEVTVTWLAGCRPVSYHWRQYTDPDAVGECIDAPVFYLANGCIGLVVDVAILLVPIPTVYKLKLALSQKIMVCGILLLGSFVCVASAVRIVMMYRLVNAAGFTWAMSNVFIWSCCEPFVGIICACLPTYAPLVRRGRGARRLRHAGGSGSDGHYSSSKSNGSRHEWSVRGAFDKKLGDDEMELTTNVLGGHQNHQNHARITSMGSETGAPKILIQRDFSWSASR